MRFQTRLGLGELGVVDIDALAEEADEGLAPPGDRHHVSGAQHRLGGEGRDLAAGWQPAALQPDDLLGGFPANWKGPVRMTAQNKVPPTRLLRSTVSGYVHRAIGGAAISITIERIRRLIGEPAFSRGLDYNRAGRVLKLVERGEDGMILASVQGSAKTIYKQQIALELDSRGTLIALRAVCDCPVGRNCKHAAAALIAIATREATPTRVTPDPPSSLPPALEAWLARVRAADAPAPARPEVGGDGYPDSVRDRMIYVVEVAASGSPAITPMKVSLRKDGTLSKSARRFDASRLAWQETPKFLRAEDVRILRRIDFLGLNPSVYSVSRGAPEPGEVIEVLSLIAATGRGRLGEVHGPVLSEAGVRTGRLTWIAQPDGRQKPRAADGDDQELIFIASDPPAYVEPATGAFGPLSFDFPAKLALAVLAAPDIPPEATDAVAEELGKLGAGMPAPRRIRTETRTGIEPTPVLRLFALRARPRGRWGAPGAPVDLPALRLAFDYGGRYVPAGSPHDPKYRDGDTIVTLRRDRAFENRAFDHLTALGPLPIDHLDMSFGRGAEPFDLAFAEDATPGMFEGASDALAFAADTVPQLSPTAGASRSIRAGPFASMRAPCSFAPRWRTAARTGFRSA